jgi:hypothetical protein
MYVLIKNACLKKIWTSFWNIFRPSVETNNFYGIFVFGRNNKNKKKTEKFSPNEKYPAFRPSLAIEHLRLLRYNCYIQ